MSGARRKTSKIPRSRPKAGLPGPGARRSSKSPTPILSRRSAILHAIATGGAGRVHEDDGAPRGGVVRGRRSHRGRSGGLVHRRRVRSTLLADREPAEGTHPEHQISHRAREDQERGATARLTAFSFEFPCAIRHGHHCTGLSSRGRYGKRYGDSPMIRGTNFVELRKAEVRRNPLLGTWVNSRQLWERCPRRRFRFGEGV